MPPATGHGPAERESEDHARPLKALADASIAINRAVDLDEAISITTEQAREVIGAHQAVVSLMAGGDWSQVISGMALSDKYAAYRALDDKPDGSGIYALVCRDNRPLRLTQEQLEAHPAWRGFGAYADEHPPMRGWLAVPLVARDGANLGVIQLSDKYQGDFTAADEALLVQLAQLASARIENAQLLIAEHKQRAFFELVMQSTTDGIAAFDRDGRITLANRRIAEITGYGAGELAGKTPDDVFAEQDADALWRDFSRVIGEGTAISAREADVVRKDGGRRRVRFSLEPLRERGDIVGAAGTMQDITETRRLEEHVLRSQRLESLGRLAGGIAHDFSNLMTVIIGHVELDLMSPPPEDVLKRDLTEIHETAMRAANLAQQLLAFSRRQMIEPAIVDLDDLVRGTERMLRRIIGEHIDLRISSRLDRGLVRVDQGQIELVLVNLALNARDAMPEGGTLNIETSAATIDAVEAGGTPVPYYVITVSDTGCGMTEDVKQHLFEPFFTTKDVGRGTGLGLATCYGIVKQAGGQIWVDSEPGHGTAVRMYLPAICDAPAGPEERHAAPALPGGKETVLLVEDEPLVRRLASRVLGGLGYTVLEAANGEEALRLARAGEAFDLLLTDVVMPGMGGQELAQAARAMRPDARVLFMSGYTDDAVVRRGLSERSIDFLQKPFTPSALAMKVRHVLDAPPRRD